MPRQAAAIKILPNEKEEASLPNLNLDWKRRETPKLPKSWNAAESLKTVKAGFFKWKNLTDEILNELWIAKKKLKAPGRRTDFQPLKNFSEVRTWEQYCESLGTSTQSVNGWLTRAFESDEKKTKQEYKISDEYRKSVEAVLDNINLDTDNIDEPKRLLGTHVGISQTKKWKGNVFLNLYNKKLDEPEEYIKQLFIRLGNGRVKQAVILVSPKSIGEEWFSPLYKGLFCFTHDHLKLQNRNDEKEEKEDKFGGCFVYFGNREKQFINEFRKNGTILKAVES